MLIKQAKKWNTWGIHQHYKITIKHDNLLKVKFILCLALGSAVQNTIFKERQQERKNAAYPITNSYNH